MSHVRCQVSGVRCHLSGVTCQVKYFIIFLDKVMKIVGLGFVINGAYPVQFKKLCFINIFVIHGEGLRYIVTRPIRKKRGGGVWK